MKEFTEESSMTEKNTLDFGNQLNERMARRYGIIEK
jgi:hypothetical protein